MVDNNFKEAAFGQDTDEVVLELLTISHPDFAIPVRLVRNNENFVSQGETFIASGFELIWPQQAENEVPRASIRHENVSRELIAAIRSIRTPASVKMQIVLASDPNNVQLEIDGMFTGRFDYDANILNFEVSFELFSQERFPKKTFNPAKWPGIFS